MIDNAFREEYGFADAMGDEHHRAFSHVPQAQKLFLHRFSRNLVECREGLIHQKDRRPESKRPAKRNTLLHAPGEFMRQPIFESAETVSESHRRARAMRSGVGSSLRAISIVNRTLSMAVRHGSSNGR